MTNKIYNEFSDVSSRIGYFESTFNSQVKDGDWLYHVPPKNGSICTSGTPEGGVAEITKATNKSASGHG